MERIQQMMTEEKGYLFVYDINNYNLILKILFLPKDFMQLILKDHTVVCLIG